MKRFNFFKAAQLLLFLIITGFCLALILFDPQTRNFVAKNEHIRLICSMLWIVLVLSFIFLFVDFQLFSGFQRSIKNLDQAVHADTITGIPNRFSCDSLIEKYIGEPLPPNMGCIMIDLTNIIDINNAYGREAGDDAIRQFSEMLHLVSAGLCFVGRNGGNKFITIFENCEKIQLVQFLNRLNEQMAIANRQGTAPVIRYKCGTAYHDGTKNDGIEQITELISLANRRIYAPDTTAH